MSREKITRTPVASAGKALSGDSVVVSKTSTPDIADEIVSTIGKDNLLDIKFFIEPSSATRDEILAEALKWVKGAEKKLSEGSLHPLSR